ITAGLRSGARYPETTSAHPPKRTGFVALTPWPTRHVGVAHPRAHRAGSRRKPSYQCLLEPARGPGDDGRTIVSLVDDTDSEHVPLVRQRSGRQARRDVAAIDRFVGQAVSV